MVLDACLDAVGRPGTWVNVGVPIGAINRVAGATGAGGTLFISSITFVLR